MLAKILARQEGEHLTTLRRSNFWKTHRWRGLVTDEPHALQMSKDENKHYLVKQQNVILEIYTLRGD
jgi:hypothetical protein